MQKLFDFSKAHMLLPEDDERLMKILEIAKEYDYIFEFVDDEFKDHWNFRDYEYSREEGDEYGDFKQRITRSHSKRDILIGLDIVFSKYAKYAHIRLGNLNGY